MIALNLYFVITARHTEYGEGNVFSLSVNRGGGGVPVVKIFATRCPTDLAGVGGGTCSLDFCHQISH